MSLGVARAPSPQGAERGLRAYVRLVLERNLAVAVAPPAVRRRRAVPATAVVLLIIPPALLRG